MKRYISGEDNPDHEKNIWKPVLVIWSIVVVMALVYAVAKLVVG